MFKKKDIQIDNQTDEIELVLLRTVNNDYELNLTVAILDEHNIPYVVRDHGIGGHMRLISGTSLYRTDILVEKSMYEKIKSILDEFPWNEENEEI